LGASTSEAETSAAALPTITDVLEDFEPPELVHLVVNE